MFPYPILSDRSEVEFGYWIAQLIDIVTMAELPTNIETIAYVVHGPKEDFKLETIVLDDIQDNEVLVDMKYSGICHTVGR